MGWQPNPGSLPPESVIYDAESGEVAGYRAVHVRLHGGWDSKKAGSAPWPAKGGRPIDTNWRISKPPHRYEIREFEVQ